jgi:hypothetical protein
VIIRISRQYYVKRDEDGITFRLATWRRARSVTAETLPLKCFDEATTMEIVDAMSKRHLASEKPGGASAERARAY